MLTFFVKILLGSGDKAFLIRLYDLPHSPSTTHSPYWEMLRQSPCAISAAHRGEWPANT